MELKEGQEVEVLDEKNGFKDTWYHAKIIKLNRMILVEYDNLWATDQQGSQRLRDFVKKCSVRPLPPREPNQIFECYQEVDAYHNDGWKKGTIIEVDKKLLRFTVFTVLKEKVDFGAENLESSC
ncbi:hypothetical protein IFM89_009111 [Coptis chinensis]|uniref:Agenet domain-containing protein n=1 Tax=Coptis chinensis TaxID=261450 RepID=A0A835LRD1_9MAGN|nr:hypothetical protein IFM89_009111 [Coptis chinensis]